MSNSISRQKLHWPSILILIILGLGAASLLTAAIGMGLNSIYKLFLDDLDPAGSMILAGAFGFEFLILFGCFMMVYQKTAGNPSADINTLNPFRFWHLPLVIVTVITAIALGTITAFAGIKWLSLLILPFMTLLVILPPIWLFLGLGSAGFDIGPRWRAAGILGIGLTAGPFFMILLEMGILILMVLLGAVVIAVHDAELIRQFTEIASQLEGQADSELILGIVAPYLKSPVFITAILGYIALIVPLIEELLKPLAIWIFARTIPSPSQGFSLGMLSGAAFAVLESLSASGDGSSNWPVIVSVRAGTSLLHIAASGLVGWGITRTFLEKRTGPFFKAYLCAVLIHGIWNACAIGAGFSTIGQFIGSPQWIFNILPAAAGGMLVLAIGMFGFLLAARRTLTETWPAITSKEISQEMG